MLTSLAVLALFSPLRIPFDLILIFDDHLPAKCTHTHTLELANQPINQSTYSAIFYLQNTEKIHFWALLSSKAIFFSLITHSPDFCSTVPSLSRFYPPLKTRTLLYLFLKTPPPPHTDFCCISLDADLHNIYFLLIWTTTTTTLSLSTHFQITQTHTFFSLLYHQIGSYYYFVSTTTTTTTTALVEKTSSNVVLQISKYNKD